MANQTTLTRAFDDIYIETKQSKGGNDYDTLVFELDSGEKIEVFLERAEMKLLKILALQANLAPVE